MKYLFFIFCICSLKTIAQTDEATDSLIIKVSKQTYLEHIPNDTTNGYFINRDSIGEKTIALRIKLTFKPAMGSVLEIFNPYEVPFTYKASIYNFKKKKYVEVAVYPVQPKMGVREMWDFPIESIVIKHFKFLN